MAVSGDASADTVLGEVGADHALHGRIVVHHQHVRSHDNGVGKAVNSAHRRRAQAWRDGAFRSGPVGRRPCRVGSCPFAAKPHERRRNRAVLIRVLIEGSSKSLMARKPAILDGLQSRWMKL